MGEYICGKNSVLEAIKNQNHNLIVYTSKSRQILNRQVRVIYKTNQELDQMVQAHHQGFVAEVATFYYDFASILKDAPSKILILDHIEDPHNFGAIIRSANAAGVKHIIIPKNRAVKVTPIVTKVASGGQIGMKIIVVASLISAIDKLKAVGFWIYASALEKAQNYQKVTFNYPLALVVGNEGKGISQTILKHADQNILIPMQGNVQSLNVAVAAGILLFAI